MAKGRTEDVRVLRRLTALLCMFALVLALVPYAWADTPTLTTGTGQASAAQSRYDARDLGYISPVRLQDPWGACWAFGALSAMEANLVKQGLASSGVELSPRHLIYFAGTPVGESAGAQAGEGQYPIDELLELYGENAVFEMGGHAYEVASAISSGEGVVYESSVPYQNEEEVVDDTGTAYAEEGSWAVDESLRFEQEFMLKNMHRFPSPARFEDMTDVDSYTGPDWSAIDAIKQAIIDYGAVSVSYCAYGSGGFYNAENFTSFTNETTAIDHDVCIVGWDDTIAADLFTTGKDGTHPEGPGAWIVKNSWGAASEIFPNNNNWGNEGYFYLSYYDRAATAFTAWEMMAKETSVTYQHDYMGQRSNAQTRVDAFEPVAYANVFTASSTQSLEAVSVNTYAPGTDVTIQVYLLPDKDEGGFSLDNATLLSEQQLTIEWAGYHRIDLKKAPMIQKGKRFAVVVSAYEVDASGTRIPVASIEAGNNEAMLGVFNISHYDRVVCNEGETYILATVDGVQRWIDGVEFGLLLQEVSSDNAWYGNACIKVFANPAKDPEAIEDPTPAPKPAPVSITKAAQAVQKVAPAQTPAPRTTAATADTNSSLIALFSFLLCISVFGLRQSLR